MRNPKLARLDIQIDPELKEELGLIAGYNYVSTADMVRRILMNYAKRNSSKALAREEARQYEEWDEFRLARAQVPAERSSAGPFRWSSLD